MGKQDVDWAAEAFHWSFELAKRGTRLRGILPSGYTGVLVFYCPMVEVESHKQHMAANGVEVLAHSSSPMSSDHISVLLVRGHAAQLEAFTKAP